MSRFQKQMPRFGSFLKRLSFWQPAPTFINEENLGPEALLNGLLKYKKIFIFNAYYCLNKMCNSPIHIYVGA